MSSSAVPQSPAAARLHPCSAAGKCRRVLCVRATCGARALWGPRSGRDGAGRGISAAQTPPAGAAGGPRAGVVAVATSARGGCRRGGAATTCRAARGGAALRGRGGGQGRRPTREARSALTGRPPCPPSNTKEHACLSPGQLQRFSLREVTKGLYNTTTRESDDIFTRVTNFRQGGPPARFLGVAPSRALGEP